MKKITNWLKYWFGMSSVSSQMSILEIRIKKLLKEKRKSDNEIQNHKSRLTGIQKEFDKGMTKVNQAVDRSTGLNKRLELALVAAQEEIKIATEITIPGLVAANTTFVGAWDAQSAQNEMRTVASNSPQREIE